MHDPNRVLLGSTRSNDKVVTCEPADPAIFKAGLAVRRKSDGGLQLADDDVAGLVGVSLGRSLSDTKKTAVCQVGNDVPLCVTDETAKATGKITITNYANLVSGGDDSITVGGVAFVAQAGAATPGDATFQAATSNDATAASLAAQINAHATTGPLVTSVAASADVNLEAKEDGTDGNSIGLSITEGGTGTGATVSGANLSGGSNAYDYVVVGQPVKLSDTTGKATSDGDETAAVYLTGQITGENEDGTETPVAMITMPGGF